MINHPYPQAPAEGALTDERARFESWARPLSYYLLWFDDKGACYNERTQHAWEVWQGCRATAQAPAPAAAEPTDVLEVQQIRRYLDGLVIPTRGEDGEQLSLIGRINLMTAKCVKAKKDLAESRHQTAASLERRLNASEAENERLRAAIAASQPSPQEPAQAPAFEVRADGETVRIDRWEVAVRRIVALLWGNRHEFEVDEVVDAVRRLATAPHDDDESLVRAVLWRQEPKEPAQAEDAARLDVLTSADVNEQWIVAKGEAGFTVYLGRRRHATRPTLRAAIDAARNAQQSTGGDR